jgi:hypothetical protein
MWLPYLISETQPERERRFGSPEAEPLRFEGKGLNRRS